MPFRPFEARAASVGRNTTTRVAEPEAGLRTLHLSGTENERGRPRAVGWHRGTWLLISALGVTAFVLGYCGARGTGWGKLRDALHLFPSGFPGPGDPHDRATLVAARYVAAVVSLSVTLRVVLGVYRRHFESAKARRRSGHSVICGVGDKGSVAGAALLARGRRVTAIELDPSNDGATELRSRGGLILEGDARKGDLLATARVERVAVVVCTCREDADNAEIAIGVANHIARHAKPGRTVDVHVHIADPDTAHALRAPALAVVGVRMVIFNSYERRAAALCQAVDLPNRTRASPPQIVIVGRTMLSEALIAQLGRQWHDLHRSQRLPVIVVASDSAEAIDALNSKYPALPNVTTMTALSVDALSLEAGLLARKIGDLAPGALVFVCLDADADNLRVALTVRRGVAANVDVIVPGSRWLVQQASGLLGTRSGIDFVSEGAEPARLDLLRDSAQEAMAKAVHERYRQTLRSGPASTDIGAADVDWAALPDDLREADRSHVDRMIVGLRSFWLEPAPLDDWDEPWRVLSPLQIEILAEDEHRRWCAERAAKGWRRDTTRDDARRLHPYLVGWSELPDAVQKIDRGLVQAWPEVLHGAGFRLAVSAEREALARVLHEHYEAPDTPLLRPWNELDETERELNRSAVDEIPEKLHSIGARVVAAGRTEKGFAFTPEEVEALARVGHDRWCRVRSDHGWIYGATRDDAARQHPDLVSWPKLPEARREIDRDHVRVLPALLRTAGLAIERVTV